MRSIRSYSNLCILLLFFSGVLTSWFIVHVNQQMRTLESHLDAAFKTGDALREVGLFLPKSMEPWHQYVRKNGSVASSLTHQNLLENLDLRLENLNQVSESVVDRQILVNLEVTLNDLLSLIQTMTSGARPSGSWLNQEAIVSFLYASAGEQIRQIDMDIQSVFVADRENYEELKLRVFYALAVFFIVCFLLMLLFRRYLLASHDRQISQAKRKLRLSVNQIMGMVKTQSGKASHQSAELIQVQAKLEDMTQTGRELQTLVKEANVRSDEIVGLIQQVHGHIDMVIAYFKQEKISDSENAESSLGVRALHELKPLISQLEEDVDLLTINSSIQKVGNVSSILHTSQDIDLKSIVSRMKASIDKMDHSGQAPEQKSGTLDGRSRVRLQQVVQSVETLLELHGQSKRDLHKIMQVMKHQDRLNLQLASDIHKLAEKSDGKASYIDQLGKMALHLQTHSKLMDTGSF